MRKLHIILLGLLLAVISFCLWLFLPPRVDNSLQLTSDSAAIARGEYLVIAGGCISCHRDEENPGQFSGGLGLKTDFGTFYAPNITPDIETGIGSWTAQDFLLALKHGRTPGGSFYYPAFPYRAYAGLSDEDVLDMAAYLKSLTPVTNPVPSAEIPFWLQRWTIAGWNLLANLLAPAPESRLEITSLDDELVARGAYLARHLGHCGECHTPRNGLGIPDSSREYAGAELGDDVIEPIDAAALSEWSRENFSLFLLIGMKPDAEFVGGDMNDVIEHNTSKLTDADRDALAAFFIQHRQ